MLVNTNVYVLLWSWKHHPRSLIFHYAFTPHSMIVFHFKRFLSIFRLGKKSRKVRDVFFFFFFCVCVCLFPPNPFNRGWGDTNIIWPVKCEIWMLPWKFCYYQIRKHVVFIFTNPEKAVLPIIWENIVILTSNGNSSTAYPLMTRNLQNNQHFSMSSPLKVYLVMSI